MHADHIRKARMRLLDIEYCRGRGVLRENQQRVLNALWDASRIVGTPGMLQREVFRVLMYKPNGRQNGHGKYLRELSLLGCFGENTKVEERKGLPFIQIELVREKIPDDKVKKPVPEKKTLQHITPRAAVIPEESEPVSTRKQGNEAERRDTHNAAFIFVDAGNMTGKRRNDGETRVLSLSQVNWYEFYRLIVSGYGDKEIVAVKRALVYLYAEISDRPFVLANTRFAGFEPIFHHKRDTDVLMAGDIGLLVRDAMDEHEKVTVVLVSGDGDYNRTLVQLKQIAQEKNVALRIWVIAWESGLSRELRYLADSVTYLENVESCLIGMRNLSAYA